MGLGRILLAKWGVARRIGLNISLDSVKGCAA